MKSLYKKIFAAKKEIGKISKDSTNPFFKSKYFDINQLLEHIEKVLQKHDLLLLQPIIKNEVITQIFDIETGNKIESYIELPALQDPQNLGSAITYYRRYTLQSLLALQAEDDDGNKSSSKTPQKTAPAKTANEPEKWLNIYKDKSKQYITTEFTECWKAIDSGKYKIADIRKKYKVSKETAIELGNKFFFELSK